MKISIDAGMAIKINKSINLQSINSICVKPQLELNNFDLCLNKKKENHGTYNGSKWAVHFKMFLFIQYLYWRKHWRMYIIQNVLINNIPFMLLQLYFPQPPEKIWK